MHFILWSKTIIQLSLNLIYFNIHQESFTGWNNLEKGQVLGGIFSEPLLSLSLYILDKT